MNDEQLREAYERGLPTGESRPALDDLAAERLRKLVEREGSDEERLHTVDALLATAEGRRDMEIVWAAARASRPVRRSGWWRVAAAALLTVTAPAVYFATQSGERIERGDESPITLVAPIGVLKPTDVSRFIWRGVPDADRYTLVVVDSAGNEVFATETRDTALVLPAHVTLRAGNAYLWWVQARTRMGESVTAVTQRVRVADR